MVIKVAIKGVLEKKESGKKISPYVYKNIILVIVGLILFLIPKTFNNIVGLVLGFLIFFVGLTNIFNYLQNKIGLTSNLVNGILYSVFGTFIMLYPSSVIRLIALCLGIYLFINALLKTREAFTLKELENNWIPTFVVAIILFLLGGLLIFNPFSGEFITKILGILLIIVSVFDIFNK